MSRRDRPARRLRGLDQHRLAAERREDVAIGRIAGHRDRDAVAGLEQREEGQDEPGRRAGGDDDARRVDLDAVASRDNAARCARAATGCRAPRCSASGPTRAPRAPPRSRVAGAGAAGWPTSMWMTRPPAASMRAAAAITSITMNGGTSLRAEGAISRLAASSMHRCTLSVAAAASRPAVAAFRRLIGTLNFAETTHDRERGAIVSALTAFRTHH